MASIAELVAGVAEPFLREQIAAEIEARVVKPEADWTRETLRYAARIARGSAGSAATLEATRRA